MIADPRSDNLDEATGSIDVRTGTRFPRALVVRLRRRTGCVVAPRLSTIRHADLVPEQ